VELDEMADPADDPADDPEVVLQKKNRSEALRHSLARLSLFRAKDGSDGPPSGRNGERDFHDERRSATSAEVVRRLK
jgi:hypothetical protein